MPIRIAINGAAGRMGRRLMALTVSDPDLYLAGALEYEGHPRLGVPVSEIEPEAAARLVLSPSLSGIEADAMIDFSTPEGTVHRAREAAEQGIALVIGTTGMTPGEAAAVKEASAQVPVIHAGNFSLGINLLVRVAAEVAKALGEDFDIEIAETHHNQKADAPSGTALMLAHSICKAQNRDPADTLVDGRTGRPGARPKGEIGMHALRMGSVVGDHTVHYGSLFERVELTHKAQTRDVFAAGALRAAKWLVGKVPGLYTMDDVLFG